MVDGKNERQSSQDSFRKPSPLNAQPSAINPRTSSRLMRPPTGGDLRVPTQAGCSTLGAGGYRNKVVLKPGHSALDWSELSARRGTQGQLVTGITKLVTDPEIQQLNNPQALMALQHNVPSFKIYPPIKITKAQLQKHSTAEDCWCLLNQRVYCISSYLDFHPGGAEILLKTAAGKDATALFNKYHRWVNYERLLETCLVGVYVP
ncbi:LAQU0S01e09824g1_1 [Lachancea quebecensis]|uniref:LAQU0S01e09824g1_1 n=1 Tax=Lachancea quebecensis TaxID=1654605 RepID=A0A0P1KPE1_9SACH|nr:LAQU0S01e09824g1_1 [Lachancea quebecensis]